MVVVDGKGVPLGISIASASPAEVTLVPQTLNTIAVPRPRGGRPRKRPDNLIGDKGYDSDALRADLAERGIHLISPYRKNRVTRPYQDRRRLRRYRRRWIVERTFAWFGAFRRLLVRHERNSRLYLAFVQFAAALIALRGL